MDRRAQRIVHLRRPLGAVYPTLTRAVVGFLKTGGAGRTIEVSLNKTFERLTKEGGWNRKIHRATQPE